VLDAHSAAPLAVTSAVVLVRQGLCTWMQLDDGQRDDGQRDEDPARNDRSRSVFSLGASEHSELLRVLTSLVLDVREKDVCNEKESA